MEYQISFKIKREGVWEDKSQFVQLPINIKETLDDTMDTAEVILGLTDDSQEYEAWDEVDLRLSIDGSSRNYYMVIQKDRLEEVKFGIETSKWNHNITLIEATHKLSTLQMNDFSLTQPLETIVAPTLAIKRDVSTVVVAPSILNQVDIGREIVFPYADWRNTGVIVTGTEEGSNFGSLGIVGGLVSDNIIYVGLYDFTINIPQSTIKRFYNFDTDTNVQLPALPTGRFKVGAGEIFKNYFWSWDAKDRTRTIDAEQLLRLDLSFNGRLVDMTTGQNISNVIIPGTNRINMSSLTIGRTYRYIISTGSTQNGVFWDNPNNNSKLNNTVFTFVSGVTVVGDTVQNVLASPTNINVLLFGQTSMTQRNTPSTLKPYEYYYEFTVNSSGGGILDSYFIDDTIVKALDNTVTRQLTDYRFPFGISSSEFFNIPSSDRVTITVPLVSGLSALNNFNNYLGNGYINFGLGDGFRFNETDPNNPLTTVRTTYYQIKSLLAEGVVQPFDPDYDKTFPSITYTIPKIDYELDGDLLEYVSNIPSPEFSFAGGKNLLEVLFEIGKTFNGVPKLKLIDDREIISFDILSKKIKDNPGFDHGNNPIVKESDADNYATGLVSVVENAVNDEITLVSSSFYPSKNGWIKPKAKDINESIFNLSKMAVVIENENSGIQRIIKVQVRNFNNNINDVADISAFVVDKNVYNSLDPTVASRGRYLYYEQGKNFIDGLSYLPNKSELVGALGDKYAIQLAIEASGRSTTTNRPIADYEFRIEYVPVFNNLRLFSEQSKVLTEKKRIFNAYSQSERNISILQYGENADVILKRTGVNSITSTYLITSPVELPFIGEELKDGGFTYYADNITYTYDNQAVITKVDYTRDINKIDKFVGYNKKYREYELYGENYVWKQKNVNRYCYITSQPILDKEFTPSFAFKNSIKALFSGTVSQFSQGPGFPNKIDLAVLQFFDIDGKKLKYNFNNQSYRIPNIVLNVLSGYTNNSLFFVNSMADNYSAGNTLERIPMSDSNAIDYGQELQNFLSKTSIQQVGILRALEQQLVVRDENGDNFEDNRKRLNSVRYVNDLGRAAAMKISYFDSDVYVVDETFPKAKTDLQLRELVPNSKITETIYIDKDNRDAIQNVMQIHFISKEKDITILSPFLKYNRLIANPNFTDSQTLGDYTGKLIIVGIEDLKKSVDEKRVDYQQSDILQNNVTLFDAVVDASTVVIPVTSFIPTKNYEAYGLVYANTKELAIVFERPLTQGIEHFMPITYIGFSDNPI